MPTSSNKKKLIETSKILVVDDSASALLMLKTFLGNAGFKNIEEARNGEQGLEKILSWQPDLVLMDVQMPVMTGIEACERLREMPNCNPVIIIQTASDSRESVTEAFKCGATDFILKPVKYEELVSRALSHLERRSLSLKVESDYVRLRNELKEAAILQSFILPKDIELDEISRDMELDVGQYYQPSSDLGGDYLTIKKIDDNRLALVMADVCGHGITSALYAFTLHTLLQDKKLYEVPPAQALEKLNIELCNLMVTGKFVTMFLGIIDIKANNIRYAAAASPEPVLFSNGKPEILETRGHLLSISRESKYETFEHSFKKGDFIFLYSDALVETPNDAGDSMGESELVGILEKAKNQTAGEIMKKVAATFFTEYSKSPSDDFSLLVCKR